MNVIGKVLAALVGLSLVAGGVACSQSPEEDNQTSGFVGASAARPVRVLTWNICGDICWPKADPDSFYPNRDFRGDNNTRASAIIHAIDAWGAEAIALQEVCESQYDEVAKRLRARGWQGAFYKKAIDPVGHCDGYVNNNPRKRSYGDAVFTKDKVNSYSYQNIQGDDYPSSPGYKWFMTCAHTNKYSFCTVHIRTKCAADYVGNCTTLKNAQQTEQITIIRAALRKLWLTRPVILLGDFNSFPNGTALPLYTDFIEADAAQNEATVVKENTSKIDMIFYDKAHWKNQDGDSAAAGPGTISDHRLLRGLAYRK